MQALVKRRGLLYIHNSDHVVLNLFQYPIIKAIRLMGCQTR